MAENYIRRSNRNSNIKIIPVCIVVDTSGSMNKTDTNQTKKRIERLTDGINSFINLTRNDDFLSDSLEIAIVTYNVDADVLMNFKSVESIKDVYIHAEQKVGDSPKGVECALNLIENKKQMILNNGQKHKTPWIIIFSDGVATGEKDGNDRTIATRLSETQWRLRKLEESKKINVIPVFVSDKNRFQKAIDQMKGYSAYGRTVILDSSDQSNGIVDFFKNLSSSISSSNVNMMFEKKTNPNNNFDESMYKKPVQTEDVILNETKKESNKNLFVYNFDFLKPSELLKVSYNPSMIKNGNWNEKFYSYDSLRGKERIEIELNLEDKNMSDLDLYVGIYDSKHNFIDNVYEGKISIPDVYNRHFLNYNKVSSVVSTTNKTQVKKEQNSIYDDMNENSDFDDFLKLLEEEFDKDDL